MKKCEQLVVVGFVVFWGDLFLFFCPPLFFFHSGLVYSDTMPCFRWREEGLLGSSGEFVLLALPLTVVLLYPFTLPHFHSFGFHHVFSHVHITLLQDLSREEEVGVGIWVHMCVYVY